MMQIDFVVGAGATGRWVFSNELIKLVFPALNIPTNPIFNWRTAESRFH